MNWEENLILARGLAKQPFEVTERAAVGRAYYGAFNLARRWLEAMEYERGVRPAYEFIAAYDFEQSADPNAK